MITDYSLDLAEGYASMVAKLHVVEKRVVFSPPTVNPFDLEKVEKLENYQLHPKVFRELAAQEEEARLEKQWALVDSLPHHKHKARLETQVQQKLDNLPLAKDSAKYWNREMNALTGSLLRISLRSARTRLFPMGYAVRLQYR